MIYLLAIAAGAILPKFLFPKVPYFWEENGFTYKPRHSAKEDVHE
ncbi:hypothetical protein P4V41_07690 [Fictibacillus nanhaiensis]|nr:hypothetical protein [Fictibacillus nanhaiensis]